MDKNLLRSFIARYGDTAGRLAEALGISATTLSYKMNQRKGADFTQREISLIRDRYRLSAEEINDIFFAKEVS